MKQYVLSAVGGAAGAALLAYLIAKHHDALDESRLEAEKNSNYELAKQRGAAIAAFQPIHRKIYFAFLVPSVVATVVGGWKHGLVALGAGVAAEAVTLKSLGYFKMGY